MPQQAISIASRDVRQLWLKIACFSLGPLIAYVEIVCPWDLRYTVLKKWYVVCPLFAVSVALTYFALKHYSRRVNAERGLQNIALLSVTLIFGFLGTDTIFNVYSRMNPGFHFKPGDLVTGRDVDRRTWDGELMPHEYSPTAGNFWVFKPGQIRSGDTYGEHYYPDLLKHQVLRDEVLQLRHIEFMIDQYGLRNTTPPSESDVFVLGDSFAFGYHMTQSSTFPSLLKSRLGKPVYNMGVSGVSPFQEYLILDYFLKTNPDVFKPRDLLWLIFEGNDLEDSYAETRDEALPVPRPTFREKVLTTLASVARLPMYVREQSVVRRLAIGEVSIGNGKEMDPHYRLDGETIAFPLYHSARFGYKLFRQSYIDHAAMPESYVLNHPNRPHLDKTFDRMKDLSQQHHFGVTVVIVPSAPRLYKDDFEGFPPIADPYFIRYITLLAQKTGFDVLDLNDALKPYSSQELLYHRDDTHWNERGHQIVAQILSDDLLRRRTPRPEPGH